MYPSGYTSGTTFDEPPGVEWGWHLYGRVNSRRSNTVMAISKMQRVHVPFFCEGCGKESFEGYVYGRYTNRQVTASHGDRTMYCEECRPAPDFSVVNKSVSQLSSWFTRPADSGDA